MITFCEGYLPDCTEQLQQVCAGQVYTNPNSLELRWTAQDISFFLFGRPDRIVFLSMWACLWGDFFKKCKDKRKEDDLLRIHASLESGQFAVHARAYQAKHGWPAHPTMICERVLAACGDA